MNWREKFYNMKFEIGNILDGKVTGITKFGAFVELSNGKTGMVHISEVSSSYVENINDYLKEQQSVKVKVLDIGKEGNKERIALSIKQTIPKEEKKEDNNLKQNKRNRDSFKFSDRRVEETPKVSNFEELMLQFKKASTERQLDLKTNEIRRSSFSRRGQK